MVAGQAVLPRGRRRARRVESERSRVRVRGDRDEGGSDEAHRHSARLERFPRMIRVKQTFQGPTVENVPGAVRAALGRLALPVKAGQSVALTVGSRGVVNIDAIVRATVEHLKALGRPPLHHPRDGEPRRRDGGGAARRPRALRRHRGDDGLPGPRDDGRRPGRRGARAAHLARPLRGGGRLGRRHQPGQAAHRLHGRHRLRPPEDDDDRHGQAPGRRAGPPGEHPARLRADDHRARRRDAPERPDRLRARRRRERVRRDGARRGVPARRARGGRAGAPRGRRAPGWRSCPSRSSTS